MLRDHGTMELCGGAGAGARLLRTGGFAVVPNISKTIEAVRDLFETEWPEFGRHLAQGRRAGRRQAVRQSRRRRDLSAAAARDEIRRPAAGKRGSRRRRRAWYGGFVAEAVDRFCRTQEVMDSSGAGIAACSPPTTWRAGRPRSSGPAATTITATPLRKTGPWGQGPVALQQLALLKGFDLDGLSAEDPDFVHTVVECAKLAFADREAFYGDPEFVRVPMETLLSDGYNDDERRKLVGERASRELRPGHIPGHGAPPIVRVARGAEVDVAHAGAHGAGETDHRSVRGDEGVPHRRHARRHLPSRRHRPLGQHGVGDAERRLAAELAGDPRPRLRPHHARADVLARGGAAGQPGAAQAAAHHADAVAGAARRRALPGLRHAGRRPAGPVVAECIPTPCAFRPQPAGGDRRAGIPHRAFPEPRSIRASAGRAM